MTNGVYLIIIRNEGVKRHMFNQNNSVKYKKIK